MLLVIALAVLEFWGGPLTPTKQAEAESIASHVVESAGEDLDPLLVLAVILAESRGHQYARGSHGEVGLMQVRPSSGHCPRAQLYSIAGNIACGAQVLRKARKSCGGPPDNWIVAYNNPRRCGVSSYTKKVMRVYKVL